MRDGAEGFDPERHKAATRAQWDQTGGGWDAQTPRIHAWLAEATAMMLDLAGVRPGARVLDVAAGAGDQTLDAARRAGPSGYVLATDLSPGILAFARENARRAGLTNVETMAADGERLGLGEATFDAAVCRLGLMFYPDPAQGLGEMRRAVKAGGRVCTIVFSEPAKNPLFSTVLSTALKHAGLPPRDPYQPGGLLSLGKPGLIDELYARAGLVDVRTTKVSAVFRLPSAREYLDFIRTAAAPVRAIMAGLGEPERHAAWTEMEEKLAVFQTPSGWEGPNELLLTVGSVSAA